MTTRHLTRTLLFAVTLAAALALPATGASASCGTCGKGGDDETEHAKGEKVHRTCPMKGPGCVEKVKADPKKAVETLHARGETPEKLHAAKTTKKAVRAHHPEKAKPMDAHVSTDVLATLVRSDVPLVILDARAGEYDDGRRIPGAHIVAPDISKDALEKLVPDKNSLIVTYCGGVTCPLSSKLADRLREFGYHNILEYPVGIAGWAEAGYAIDQVQETDIAQ